MGQPVFSHIFHVLSTRQSTFLASTRKGNEVNADKYVGTMSRNHCLTITRSSQRLQFLKQIFYPWHKNLGNWNVLLKHLTYDSS